jgi:DNA anti-recombination protein RmuC
VAGLAASQVARLAQANQAQEDTWKQIDESMRQYQQVFSQVEKNASALLTQIGQHLRDYTQTTQQGFETLVRLADEHFKAAVERLGSSVNELDEYLQDLTGAFEKTRRHQPRGSDGSGR